MDYNLMEITAAKKLTTIGETGTVPSAEAIVNEKVGWSAYMTWSKDFCVTEDYTTEDELKKLYDSPYAVTLDRLPELY